MAGIKWKPKYTPRKANVFSFAIINVFFNLKHSGIGMYVN